jgi:DNA-binding NtrC family response regulator
MAIELAEIRGDSEPNAPLPDGTRCGSRPRMAFHVPRQRDRRAAIGDLLIALTRALDRRLDVSLMRGAFEATLRRALPLRSVRLREAGNRWGGAADAGAPESVVLEVPGGDPEMPGVLEATFDPGCCLGEWDFQVLGAASHIGALVLELERSRVQLIRAGLGGNRRPRREAATPLVGSTPAMRELRSTIERVALTDFTVLLEGESGVGKELVARQIHETSRRRAGPFVAVNCAAIVETLLEAELFGIEDRTATGVRGRRGKFEAADGGTLFLDEVSDLSPSAQAKLLRAIQDLAVERVGATGTQRVDIRIVAATNRSLRSLVEQRVFRTDLFYRLSGVDIRVPTLRERRADILELAQHFLDRHGALRPLRLTTAAADALLAHEWPGNVRELERLIEAAVTLTTADVIDVDDLPLHVSGDYAESLGPAVRRNDTLRAWASRYVRLALERCQGNKRQACERLNISYHTLNSHLRYPVHDPAAEARPWDAEPVGVAAAEAERPACGADAAGEGPLQTTLAAEPAV